MAIYIGVPGNLQAIAHMGAGIQSSPDLNAAVHKALYGGRTVDLVGDPKRTYSFQRDYLTHEEMGLLESLAYGLWGPAPYRLIDPWRRNYLTLNQSAGGDYWGTYEGFLRAGVLGVLSVVSGTKPNAATGEVLQIVTPASGAQNANGISVGDWTTAAAVMATGVPAVPALAYTFQLKAKTTTANVSAWRALIYWYDKAGGGLSTATGSAVSLVNGTYTTYTVTGTAPANTAFALGFFTNNATLTTIHTIQMADFQFSQASTTEAWVPGTGVPRVAFTSVGDTYSVPLMHSGNFTLVEVA